MELSTLTTRFRGPLIGFFAGQGSDPRSAQELAQDVLAEAYLSRERFEGSTEDVRAVGAWLRGIAANLLRTSFRRAQRSPTPLTDEHLDIADERASDPARVAQRTEAHARLREHLDALRGPWKTVLYMHYVEGSGLAEIGALLDLSPRAVEGRLRRAREELKQSLTRAEEPQP